MKRTSVALYIAFLIIAAGVPAYAVGSKAHEGHVDAAYPAQHRLSLDQGRKWATDEPLRRHMDALRAMLGQHRAAILERKLSAEQAKALGQAIEGRVAAIVTDCKLDPRADANLHLIVADFVEAADILKGKSRHQPDRGAGKAVRAAEMYATYFDHPGWTPIY